MNNKQEFAVTVGKGFDRKTQYIQAESAAEVQETLEREFAYEMEFEGMFIVDIKPI